MTTTQTIRRGTPPTTITGGRDTCANGHPWTRATTRWRYRDRSDRTDGHAGSGWERDCLTCKEMADKARAKRTSAARSRSLILTVHEGGTSWGTTGGPDE